MYFKQKFIISLIIGIIHILPDVLFICERDFKGIALSATLDELFYLGRFNLLERGVGAQVGHGVYEHINDTWSIQPPYKEIFLSLPAKLLGLTNWQNDILLTFIMPIIIFWLIYYLILELCSSNIASLMAGLTIIFGYNLFVGNFSYIKNIFSVQTNSYLWFMRAVSPQLPHLVLLLCLLLSYKAIKSKSMPMAVATGVLSGFLIYINFFYWTFFILGFFIFSVFMLRKNFLHVFNIALYSVAISFIITIPFWVHYINISSIPSYQDIKFRFNIGNNKQVVMPIFQSVLFGYILFFLRKDIKNPRNLFLISFPIGGFILLNQHIITNVNFPAIYIQNYLMKTFLIISFFVVTVEIVNSLIMQHKNIKLFIRRLALVYCIFLFTFGLLIQFNYFKNNRMEFLNYQKWSKIFEWLKNNTNENDVVLTDQLEKTPIADLLLANTHNCVYLPRSIAMFISNEELLKRYLLGLKFFMYSEEDIKNNSESLCHSVYGMASLKEYGGNINCDRELPKFIIAYNRLNVTDIFKNKVDYVINNHMELRDKIIKSYPFVKVVYESDSIQIFKINPPPERIRIIT